MTESGKSEDRKRSAAQGTSMIEWLVAAVGGMLLAAMIGYMVVAGVSEAEGPPSIKISASLPVQQSGIFLVRFEAQNTGKQTASSLVVRATLIQGGKEIETSEVAIDYLPSGSLRSGGFFFKRDPQAYELELTPVGYLDP
jgi:uncharacterized protein (TIGR02588 family)